VALIVDSQVHIWREVLPGKEASAALHRPGPFDAAQLLPLMKEAGVAGAVLVPTMWDPTQNQTAINAAREYPDRFAVMGVLTSIDNISQQLASWPDQGMLGVRLATRHLPQSAWIDSGAIETFWTEAERIGLRVMGFGPGSRLQVIGESARRHPEMILAIDHLGMSPAFREVDHSNEEQIETLLPLAKLPNVSVKVSALPMFSREEFPYRDLFDPVRRVIDAFGPERCFFGTDLSRLPCSYAQAIEMMRMIIEGYDPADQDLIMGTALTRWLGWTPAEL
jgi:L-fuconolactonase